MLKQPCIEAIELGNIPASVAEAIIRTLPMLSENAEQQLGHGENATTNASLATNPKGDLFAVYSKEITRDGKTLLCAEWVATAMARRRNLRLLSYLVTANELDAAESCLDCTNGAAVMLSDSVVSDVSIITHKRGTYEYRVYAPLELNKVLAGDSSNRPHSINDVHYQRLPDALEIVQMMTVDGASEALDLNTASLIDLSWR